MCVYVLCIRNLQDKVRSAKKVKLISNTQKVSGARVYIKTDIETLERYDILYCVYIWLVCVICNSSVLSSLSCEFVTVLAYLCTSLYNTIKMKIIFFCGWCWYKIISSCISWAKQYLTCNIGAGNRIYSWL